jgi:hypothetical protein
MRVALAMALQSSAIVLMYWLGNEHGVVAARSPAATVLIPTLLGCVAIGFTLWKTHAIAGSQRIRWAVTLGGAVAGSLVALWAAMVYALNRWGS